MFDWLKQRIVQVVEWIGNLAKSVFQAGWDFVTDAFAWLVDQLLSVVSSLVNSIDLGGLNNYNAAGSLPSEIINVMSLLGVGTATNIIVAAVGIRLVLQLIPFTRLGS